MINLSKSQIFIVLTGFSDNPNIYLKSKDGHVILADGKLKYRLVKKHRQRKLEAIILETRNPLYIAVKCHGKNLILVCQRIEEYQDIETYLKEQDPPINLIEHIHQRAIIGIDRNKTIEACTSFFLGKCFNESIQRSGYHIVNVMT